MDLPVWQELYAELKDQNFVIITVALDSRADAALPWITQAAPEYPCLIDRDHQVAELYHMVNVPQAVWIDETGQIVRPAEAAGAYEGFRHMDRSTFQMPEAEQAKTKAARKIYLEAIRDWVARGAQSPHALNSEQVRAHLHPPDGDALAHANFRLGQHLLREGREQEAKVFLDEAVRLRPDSWSFWRQQAEPAVMGLAAGPEFWQRVDALGEKRYYAKVDMDGMP